MCRAMEELIEKVLRRNRLAAAQRMLVTGKLTPEEIAYYVGLYRSILYTGSPRPRTSRSVMNTT